MPHPSERLLRFQSIFLRVLRLELSASPMFKLKTSFKPLSVSRLTVNRKEENMSKNSASGFGMEENFKALVQIK
jgi:hypothetical protein